MIETRTLPQFAGLAVKPGELAVIRKSLPAEIPNEGLSAAHCYDVEFPRATDEDFMWVQQQIELAYGQKIPSNRWNQLRTMIEDEKWSGARLKVQTKAFLKFHKPIWRADTPPWIPADFFSVQSELKLYPRSWYLEQKAKNPDVKIDFYEVNGVELYRLADGIELPFPRPKWLSRVSRQEGEASKATTSTETASESKITEETRAQIAAFLQNIPEETQTARRGIRTTFEIINEN